MSNPDTGTPAPAQASHVRAAPIPRERCGMALACELLGDRWTMLVIREAFYGVTRFDDLRADLGAPRGILSSRLKALVEAGILSRHPYREGKARLRHEYRLTPRGQELSLPLIALMHWGDRHLQDEPSPLQIRCRSSGDILHVGLVKSDGQEVEAADVTYDIVTADQVSFGSK